MFHTCANSYKPPTMAIGTHLFDAERLSPKADSLTSSGVRKPTLRPEVSLDKARNSSSQIRQSGEQRTDWYDIRYWFRQFGLGEDWTGLLMSFRNEVAPFPEAVEVLEEMAKHYRLVVTSNASRDFMDIELAAAGLDGYFSNLFSCTSDFGEVKKTPEVYAGLPGTFDFTSK
jgi:FMN phosphatase YigB (HAD superfamily)